MRKQFKIILAVLLSGALLFGALGCGKTPEETETDTKGAETAGTLPEDETGDSAGESETEPVSLESESETETPADEHSSEPATKEPETEKTTEAPPATQPKDTNNGVLTDRGLYPDWASLSNQSIPYGNDWDDKDAKTGLPNGVFWYEAVYGKYGQVYRIKTTEKLIYLTFDEGYEAGFTPKILDVLKEKNVKAVFFLTKQFVDSDPELVERMIREGHILGNHTCLHPAGGYPRYVDEHGAQSFVDDVSKLHSIVYERFGYEMSLFRFPEGESSDMLVAKLKNLGYTSVFWSYAHRDWVLNDQPPVSETLQGCLDHMGTGAVYLLHAVSESNTNALADFIDGARAAGYGFGVFPTEF